MAEEYALDLEELRQLQSIAKRPRVLSFISTEILNLEKEKEKQLPKDGPAPIAQPKDAPAPTAQTSISPPALEKVPASAAMFYTTLSSFSWDQDNEKIKIYMSLEGVDQEKMETVFKPISFDVKFHDVKGKNYRFTIPKLHKEISPEKSKVVVKPTKVIVTMFKESKGSWTDLHFKEDKVKPNLDKERDPMAGIMDLMKNMYEEGDEDMKRTIAKAWTDARSGKTADPLKGYP